MISLSQCSAFIFDMDGTLTVPQHDFDHIRSLLDIPQGELILEHIAALPKNEQQHKRTRLDEIEAELAAESEPAPGLFELLDALQEQQISYGLLTRNSASNARISLRAISARERFDDALIIGRDEAAPKPSTAGIKLLANRFNTPVNQCAMVGDYRHDLEAGHAAGCHTVHIRHPQTQTWPEFTSTTVHSLVELLHQFQR